MAKKLLKIGVSLGTGDPPCVWTVLVLQFAFDEAMEFLDIDQYRHLARQFQELATQDDPTHSDTIRLKKIEDFFELCDHGGPLHPFNVRVFFGVDGELRRIVVLKTINKQNNGPTPLGDKINARSRLRKYKLGDYN